MTERLSSSTLKGQLSYVAICLLLGGLYLTSSAPGFHGLGWLLGLFWLLLGGLSSYSLRFYEVTVTPAGIQLRRLFTAPVSYHPADFAGLRPATSFGRPLCISFADGRSFLFQPRLRESYFSFHYTPREEFAAWWHEELAERAANQAGPGTRPGQLTTGFGSSTRQSSPPEYYLFYE